VRIRDSRHKHFATFAPVSLLIEKQPKRFGQKILKTPALSRIANPRQYGSGLQIPNSGQQSPRFEQKSPKTAILSFTHSIIQNRTSK
jgi:hypothetical protein